jgi:hypothetical protein
MTVEPASDELHNMCNYILTRSSVKHIFFIFIFFIMITSNTFECNCMEIKKDNYNNNETIHLLKKSITFVIIYIFIDFLIQMNII